MKNKRYIALGLLLYSSPSLANSDIQSAQLGVGVGSGTSTSAVTAKKYIQPNTAVQIFLGTQGVASSVQFFSIGGDFLIERPLQEIDLGRLFYGFGAGAGVFSYGGFGFQSNSIGISAIGEVGLHFAEAPLELVLDIRPTFFLGNVSGPSLYSGGGAIRWYF